MTKLCGKVDTMKTVHRKPSTFAQKWPDAIGIVGNVGGYCKPTQHSQMLLVFWIFWGFHEKAERSSPETINIFTEMYTYILLCKDSKDHHGLFLFGTEEDKQR